MSMKMPKLAVFILAALAITQIVPAYAIADFSISLNPTHSRLYAGLAKQVTVTVNSLNGFAGSVSFTASAPTGYSTSFNPASVSVSSGGSATSTLSITADPDCNVGPGKTIVVQGTSGSLAHNAYFTIDLVVC